MTYDDEGEFVDCLMTYDSCLMPNDDEGEFVDC
jgi:hypothetical protein